MLQRLPVILSPAAGAGGAADRIPVLRARLQARFDLQFVVPGSLDALDRALQEAAASGVPTVAVGGGDGTLHRAANVLKNADVTLAPLPVGSGNDFARGAGLWPLDAAIDALLEGGTRSIDVLEVNGRRILTVAGLGVVATAGLCVARLSAPGHPMRPLVRALGAYAYLASGGAHVLSRPRLARDVVVRWRIAGSAAWIQRTARIVGAFLAVRPTLGAGLRLPIAVPDDDGRFELVLVEDRARVRIAIHLPRLRSGAAIPRDLLTVMTVAEAELDWAGGTMVLADGENAGSADVVRARLSSAALRIPHARVGHRDA